ncbi:MAG: division/cell wall cluster transcriptional repressor MraZ [bacterium]|nr:division/cell wall cluster transcriptional repressor MraZ [bacterium]
MLIGEYRHTLDPKKRVSLPSKFRKELGKKVIISKGFDNCLFVLDPKRWEALVGKLANAPLGQRDGRDLSRFILAGAVETDVDAAGRILLPDHLKDHASLNEQVVVMGVSTRVEIWSEEVWDTYSVAVAKQADQIAERYGELGMI